MYWFGPGHFGDFLYAYTPGVELENIDLAGGLRLARDAFEHHRELDEQLQSKYEQPYPLFPEQGGWLPWAHTIDGDLMFWVTSPGDPNNWTIAAASREDDIEHFNGGFLDYLYSYIWGSKDIEFFPHEEGLEAPLRFYPFDVTWTGEGERLDPYGYFENP
ncbi:hypothetical protein [Nocardiopsis terrae]|uniref:hypothetical protein n=1 Tax=Nocardiopsis terrae TaxID=372655 RepID=UPI00178BC85C|nr:hypothetical protein [Nocardiopsis terrae]